MLGCRQIWQSAVKARCIQSCSQYRHASQILKRCSHSERKVQPEDAEEQLSIFAEDLKSDAYTKMLATPLRRCAITQLVLPKAMMFRMTSQPDRPSITSKLDVAPTETVAKELKTISHKRRSRRYVLKEAKRTKEKALLRAQRMILHKMITSITPKSRERFSKQLAQVKGQLDTLRKKGHGRLMPYGLTRESLSKSRGYAQGRGVWCTLNKKIVAEVPDRNLHKGLPSTSAVPLDLPTLLQDQMETRVVEEAQLLLQKITTESGRKTFDWLIRRKVGKEMHRIVQDGCIELRDGKQARLACLVVKEGDLQVLQQNIDVFNLQTLFSSEDRRMQVKKAFQSIAIYLNRQQRREHAHRDSSMKHDIVSSKNNEVAINHSIKQQATKWPRILAVRRDERTVDLFIALWRLKAWCQSGPLGHSIT